MEFKYIHKKTKKGLKKKPSHNEKTVIRASKPTKLLKKRQVSGYNERQQNVNSTKEMRGTQR